MVQRSEQAEIAESNIQDREYHPSGVENMVGSIAMAMLKQTIEAGKTVQIPSLGIEIHPDYPELSASKWYEQLGQLYVRLARQREGGIGLAADADPAVILDSSISPFTRCLIHSPGNWSLLEEVAAFSPQLKRFISHELSKVPNTQFYEHQKNRLRWTVLLANEHGREVNEFWITHHKSDEAETLPRDHAEAFSFSWTEMVRQQGGRNPNPEETAIPSHISPLTCYLVQYARMALYPIVERLPQDVREFVIAELEQLPKSVFYDSRKQSIINLMEEMPTELAEYFRSGEPLSAELQRAPGRKPTNNYR